ncbi:hypothetical protein J6590_020514 [Homalodisca vitripennis]|nr:hypothetical protein J6590_020514 [Homalodisca vitripennis]
MISTEKTTLYAGVLPNSEMIPTHDSTECRTYKKRWFVLALFVLYSMSNSMQWIEYSIIANVVQKYYQVPNSYIDWTSMIYMVTYIPFIFPASWLIDKLGLRVAVILGALGTCGGAWIKVLSVGQDRFYVTFLGQSVVALSQIFVLSVPAPLAATWFGPNEVSSACSIGVFGNQLGIAIGFLIPPILVKNSEVMESIGAGLSTLFYSVAILTSVLLVSEVLTVFQGKPPLPPSPAQAVQRNAESVPFATSIKHLATNPVSEVLTVFQGKPPLPPSPAQAVQRNAESVPFATSIKHLATNPAYVSEVLTVFQGKPPLPPSPAQAVQRNAESVPFATSIKHLATNPAYVLLLVSYGINVGVFYAISTLLNQIFVAHFPGKEEDAGRIGLMIVVAGMLGSVCCGIVLDKTHKFKPGGCTNEILDVYNIEEEKFSYEDTLVIISGTNDVATNDTQEAITSIRSVLEKKPNHKVTRTNAQFKQLSEQLDNVTLVELSKAERSLHTRHGMHFNSRGKNWLAEQIAKAHIPTTMKCLAQVTIKLLMSGTSHRETPFPFPPPLQTS